MSSILDYRYWQPPTDAEPGKMVEDELISGDENYIPRGAIVMLGTGLTDHTGKKIYDKDVVQFVHPNPAKNNKRPTINMLVAWNRKSGSWHLYWRQYDGEIAHQSLAKTLNDSHTIIGDAYTTPELAK